MLTNTERESLKLIKTLFKQDKFSIAAYFCLPEFNDGFCKIILITEDPDNKLDAIPFIPKPSPLCTSIYKVCLLSPNSFTRWKFDLLPSVIQQMGPFKYYQEVRKNDDWIWNTDLS